MLHAFARTPFAFGIFRSLLGVGEAANFPGIAKTISEWFPAKERTVATGIANIGAGTGALIAAPLVVLIILKLGWQEAFVITGAIGFVWVIFWMLLYKPPAQNPFITPEELEYINEGQKELQAEDAGQQKGVWKLILRAEELLGYRVGKISFRAGLAILLLLDTYLFCDTTGAQSQADWPLRVDAFSRRRHRQFRRRGFVPVLPEARL